MSLVRFMFDGMSPQDERRSPFKRGAAYVFLGEIVNMPGHCVVAEMPTGHIHSGWHTDNFVELSDDET